MNFNFGKFKELPISENLEGRTIISVRFIAEHENSTQSELSDCNHADIDAGSYLFLELDDGNILEFNTSEWGSVDLLSPKEAKKSIISINQTAQSRINYLTKLQQKECVHSFGIKENGENLVRKCHYCGLEKFYFEEE